MNILHILCSPRADGSHSTRFANAIVERLRARDPHADVVLRDLSAAQLPHVDGDYAHALAGGRPSVTGASVRSEHLIAELERADAVVIGTPMHNYTVPSSLKAWIDHVLRIQRTFVPTPEGKRGLLSDRPVYIAVASGGIYLGTEARQPDFLTPYLQAVFRTIGLNTLHFFPLQGVVRGEFAAAAAWQHATALLDAQLPAPAASPVLRHGVAA